LLSANSHKYGFPDKLLVSNKNPFTHFNISKAQICFLNYDLKNDFETFIPKINNPIEFPKEMFIEVEKTILLDDLIFDIDEKQESSSIEINVTITKENYLKKVNALKQHIQEGDIYEINYCMTFEAYGVNIDPLSIYQKLNKLSKASYSAFAKFDHLYIISSSPELYLSKRGKKLITKPIKGTAKRGASPDEDKVIKQGLYTNKKERNENVMIVDVSRNDLSRIAKKATVAVEKLYDIESYEQVHQMVSTVTCELKENITFTDIVKATFPMASMTGAPKIRAMELIDEYELYNRGPYSGTLGYIDEKGDFDLNVLIRSIFYDEKKHYLSFTVGSAITALCNAEEEYEECLLKAKAMMKVLNSDSTI